MSSILLAGLASGAIAFVDESKVLPESVKNNSIIAVEEKVRFLSNHELEVFLKGLLLIFHRESSGSMRLLELTGLEISHVNVLISLLGILAT